MARTQQGQQHVARVAHWDVVATGRKIRGISSSTGIGSEHKLVPTVQPDNHAQSKLAVTCWQLAAKMQTDITPQW